jgi:hydrogenase/urease accessory protein HupE
MRSRLLLVSTLVCITALAEPSAAFAHEIHGQAETIPDFIRLGIRHMLGGWDHLLFIAGVVLVAGQLLRAAKLVSLFVVGHSLSLLVATLAGWQLNAELVDVVIALSLAYIGWRILSGRPQVWLWTQLSVFAFGLVHGLGLSSRLQELALPAGSSLVARILAFNLGVEMGQLAVLSVLVAIGYLVRLRAPQVLPPTRVAGIGFAAAGLIGAVVLGVSGPRADHHHAAAPALCAEAQLTPDFGRKAGVGGQPKRFHEVDDPADPNDLEHALGAGYVIVQYQPSLSDDERSSLEEWANQTRRVVVTPTIAPMNGAVSAQTERLNLLCDRLDLDALSDFQRRWLAGAGG